MIFIRRRFLISLLFITLFFGLYRIGIDIGTPLHNTSELLFGETQFPDALRDALLRSRDLIYESYDNSGELQSEEMSWDDIRFLGFIRGYYLRSSILDSHKIFGMLAEMRRNKLNPGISLQYGGGYLFPLGAYLYGLDKAGQLQAVSDINYYLDHPSEIASIIISTRLFVAFSVALSIAAFFLFSLHFIRMPLALLVTSLYGLSPFILMYAHDVKPWVYSNLFFFLSAIFAARLATQARWRNYLLAGFFAGCAVGTMITTGILTFYIAANHCLNSEGKWWRRLLDKKLLISLGVSVIVFFLLNPYILIDFSHQLNYHLWNANKHYVGGTRVWLGALPTHWIYLFGLFTFPTTVGLWFLKKSREVTVLLIFTWIFYIILAYLAYTRVFVQIIPLFLLLYAITTQSFFDHKSIPKLFSWILLALGMAQLILYLVIAIILSSFLANYSTLQASIRTDLESYLNRDGLTYFYGGVSREKLPAFNLKQINLIKSREISIELLKPGTIVTLGEDERRKMNRSNNYTIEFEKNYFPPLFQQFPGLKVFLDYLDLNQFHVTIFRRSRERQNLLLKYGIAL